MSRTFRAFAIFEEDYPLFDLLKTFKNKINETVVLQNPCFLD